MLTRASTLVSGSLLLFKTIESLKCRKCGEYEPIPNNGGIATCNNNDHILTEECDGYCYKMTDDTGIQMMNCLNKKAFKTQAFELGTNCKTTFLIETCDTEFCNNNLERIIPEEIHDFEVSPSNHVHSEVYVRWLTGCDAYNYTYTYCMFEKQTHKKIRCNF